MTQVREPGERPGVGAVRDDDDLLDADPPERRPDADRVVLVRHRPVVGQPCPVLGEHRIEVLAVWNGLGLGEHRLVALDLHPPVGDRVRDVRRRLAIGQSVDQAGDFGF